MIFSNTKNGFTQVWKNKRLIVVFYLANLFFGLVLMLPFRAVLGNFSGNGPVGGQFSAGSGCDWCKRKRSRPPCGAGLCRQYGWGHCGRIWI